MENLAVSKECEGHPSVLLEDFSMIRGVMNGQITTHVATGEDRKRSNKKKKSHVRYIGLNME